MPAAMPMASTTSMSVKPLRGRLLAWRAAFQGTGM